ncbi:MAG: GNAT family N-acetyltransferase [Candidatus Omnitrophota bacterium]
MDVSIRAYDEKDRDGVRRIACATAFLGEPCQKVVSNAEVVADALSLYYTRYEPESCLVAESGGKVVGYLIGTKDSRRMSRFNGKIAAVITGKVIRYGLLFDRKNIQFIWFNFLSILKGEFRKPDHSKEYPAVIHINVDHPYRSQGIGGRLMAAFLDELRAKKIPGVRISTNTETGKQFFLKQGFHFLYSQEQTQLRYLTKQNFTNFVYGLKLGGTNK